jgi:hypothetical protein
MKTGADPLFSNIDEGLLLFSGVVDVPKGFGLGFFADEEAAFPCVAPSSFGDDVRFGLPCFRRAMEEFASKFAFMVKLLGRLNALNICTIR